MKKILFIFLILSLNLFAQEFGEVSEEELKITKCEGDADADVVVLYNHASMWVTKRFDLVMKYHKRIKILTEKGKEEANIKIKYWHEDNITGLDAISFSVDGEETELDSDNIFEEEGEKFNVISFGIPNVEIGSVIEYKYRHWSDYITRLPEWSFQSKNFTKLSKLQVHIPNGFIYNTVKLNTHLFDINVENEEVMDREIGNMVMRYTFTGKNIPALKEEPYLDNIDDKYARIIFILNSYQDLRQKVDYAQTWNNVARRVSKTYDDYIEQDDETLDLALELTKEESDKLNKAKILYDFVSSSIKQVDHKTIFGERLKSPEDVLESREGSSSEKTMLLINMLTNTGLNAKPLLISTRKNGKPVLDFKEEFQFNRIICLLTLDRKQYYLYPISSANPFGYLTPATDVGVGLLINGDEGKIIKVDPPNPFNKVIYQTECTVDKAGSLNSSSVINYGGYSAFEERFDLIDENEEDILEHVENILDEINPKAVLDTFFYKNIDAVDNTLQLSLKYHLDDYVNDTGDLLYFELPFYSAIKSNPFQREKRIYEIDYDFKKMITEEIKFYIPEGMEVMETPEKTKSETKGFKFSKYYFASSKHVSCYRTHKIESRQYPATYYPDLKKIYEDIIAADQDQLVFRKIKEQNLAGAVK